MRVTHPLIIPHRPTIHPIIQPYTQPHIPDTSPPHGRDEQTFDTECLIKICGASLKDHGFSFFIDNQIVPHHAFGKEAEENMIWDARGRITAAQYAARLFPAGSH